MDIQTRKDLGRMRKSLILIAVLFLLTSCIFDNEIKTEPIELSAREAVEMLQNSKQNSFLLYLRTESCYSCDVYEEIIRDVQETGPFEIYYINVKLNEEDEVTNNAMQELNVTMGAYNELPTTFYFYQGALLPENKKEGYLEKEVLTEWLKNLQILQ